MLVETTPPPPQKKSCQHDGAVQKLEQGSGACGVELPEVALWSPEDLAMDGGCSLGRVSRLLPMWSLAVLLCRELWLPLTVSPGPQ